MINISYQILITGIVGFSAAVVGTILMLPQIIKTIKTKKVDDLASGMLWLYFLINSYFLTIS